MTTLAQVHHATVKSARKFDYTEDSMLQKGDEVPAEVLDMMKRVCLVKYTRLKSCASFGGKHNR